MTSQIMWLAGSRARIYLQTPKLSTVNHMVAFPPLFSFGTAELDTDHDLCV